MVSKHSHTPGAGRGRHQVNRNGLKAAPSEGEGMVAAFSQEWPKGCEGGCAGRGAQGCPSKQGPCTPGGCVLGQGL